MGKRWNSEWKYYKFTKENETIIDFKEHYLMIDSNSNKKIPYEIISKIEVVEK